jgi:hypothetical protein
MRKTLHTACHAVLPEERSKNAAMQNIIKNRLSLSKQFVFLAAIQESQGCAEAQAAFWTACILFGHGQ